MNVSLLEPGELASVGGLAARYVQALTEHGPTALVGNVDTCVLALRSGERILPVTVSDTRGASYVCDPCAAYVGYGLRELELTRLRGRALVAPLLRAAGATLRAARLSRIVHVDNWLLSTNLHGDWDGGDIGTVRDLLIRRFPRHLLAVRSVDPWSAPALHRALADDGWTMVPSRQIWVMDDVAGEWPRHHAYDNDRRLLARSGLTLSAVTTLSPDEAVRIADLYAQLYLAKYSRLNPAFTPAFVVATHASGMIHYRVARNTAGIIQAVAGSFVRAGVLTPPVVGYDTAAPQQRGLYRIASWLFMQTAAERRLRLHASAGAAHFKRLRGARPVIEYWPMYTRHLSAPRRAAVVALAAVLERWVVPMMRRHQL